MFPVTTRDEWSCRHLTSAVLGVDVSSDESSHIVERERPNSIISFE